MANRLDDFDARLKVFEEGFVFEKRWFGNLFKKNTVTSLCEHCKLADRVNHIANFIHDKNGGFDAWVNMELGREAELLMHIDENRDKIKILEDQLQKVNRMPEQPKTPKPSVIKDNWVKNKAKILYYLGFSIMNIAGIVFASLRTIIPEGAWYYNMLLQILAVGNFLFIFIIPLVFGDKSVIEEKDEKIAAVKVERTTLGKSNETLRTENEVLKTKVEFLSSEKKISDDNLINAQAEIIALKKRLYTEDE